MVSGFWRFANASITLFLIGSSITALMMTAQDQSIAPGSLRYWALVLPAVTLPLLGLEFLQIGWRGGAAWLLGFGLLSGTWLLLEGDTRALVQLFLFVWLAWWASSQLCILTEAALKIVFYGALVAGVIVFRFTDYNPWGLLPAQTLAAYGEWRVSIFPTVSSTGIFALLFLMLFTKNGRFARGSKLPIAICLYLLVFSYFRTGLVAFAAYVLVYYPLSRVKLTTGMFIFLPILAVIALVGGTFVAPYVLATLQDDLPGISRLFLRGAVRLSLDEIYVQLYRPWLWTEHLRLFASSDMWMGLGSFDFGALVGSPTGSVETGTESLLTRLLATYGWPTLLLFGFLLSRLVHHARQGDAWACASFAPLIFLTLSYGSALHPSSAFFILAFMVISRGVEAFPRDLRSAPAI